MYIGARYVPIFADPVEWDDKREYEPLTIVIHNGDCYTSKCYVPKGAQLPPYPEGQTKYWVKTSDYNGQFADLKKTVLDLSRLVEQFQKDNEHFTDLINGWNEKVTQWEKDMAAWGERLDTVESNVADLTASLNAEIARAKAAEQANAAAIAQETADRKQAISELDAAYKAADAAEAQAREAGDAANAAAIAQETADRKQAISELDAAYKAADAAEAQAREAGDAANAAAIAQETADRKQAISELDAAYKAADAAEAQAREAGDAANAAAIAQETADRKQAISELDAAYKAADAAEAQARADADTALSNRITANKTGIDALKAEQAIQNTNISKNAKNISDNAAEIAKHAARLTDLESNASDWDDAFPDTTIAQEVQKEELERANADTALNGRCDTLAADVEEVRDLANHKVDTTTYTEGQAAQDTRITALEGDNTTNKTDIENIKAKDTAQDAAIQQNKDAIAHVTDSLSGYVKTETYTTGQAAQDAKITAAQNAANKANTNIGDWETDHPGQTISQCATSLENETAANAAKADANAAVIGDWNAEHPGKTIAQAVTDVSSSIPDVSGFVTETTYNQGQAAQDAKIAEAKTAADKASTAISNLSVPVNLDLVHGATPTATEQTTTDYFTLTFQIANPAFSPDRTDYNLDANNITDASIGYRVFMLTFAGSTAPIVTGTLAATPTLQMNANTNIVIGTVKVKGTRPDSQIVAVYWRGCVAGQITYKTK
jgi:hypothetical protein